MGAMVPAWWQDWQLFWKMGATSLLKVTGLSPAPVASAARAVNGASKIPEIASVNAGVTRRLNVLITGLL
jgi:hypothetical protein